MQTSDVLGRTPRPRTPGGDQPEGRFVGPLRDKYIQHTAATTSAGPAPGASGPAPARQPQSPSAAVHSMLPHAADLWSRDLRRWDISTRASVGSAAGQGSPTPSRIHSRRALPAGACRSPPWECVSGITSPPSSAGGRTLPQELSGRSSPPRECNDSTAPLAAAETPGTPDSSTVGAISIPSSPVADTNVGQSGQPSPAVEKRSVVLRLDTGSSDRHSSARYPTSPTDPPSDGSGSHEVRERCVQVYR